MQIGRLSELGPRSVWDILDDAFDLYRERWVLMCGATAIVYVPVYGLYLALLAGPMARFATLTESDPSSTALFDAMGPLWGTILALMPLLMFAQAIQTGVTSVLVRDMLSDRAITSSRQAYALVLRRFWPLLIGAILYGLAVGIGFCALFIGAVYAATLLAFVPQLVVLEGRGISDAFRRSQALTRPDWGRVLGLAMLIGAVSFLLQGGLTIIFTTLFEMLPKSGDTGARAFQQQLVSQAFQSVATLLLAPVGAIASTLLYYDLRVRREGFDLVAQAQAQNYPLAPDPFGEVSSEEARERQRREQLRAQKRAQGGR